MYLELKLRLVTASLGGFKLIEVKVEQDEAVVEAGAKLGKS